ncbi:MAG: hypothetical protein NTX94_01435 [Caldiserica bacterium]|nr:hypothetical protein [Caldisericota bacterium]
MKGREQQRGDGSAEKDESNKEGVAASEPSCDSLKTATTQPPVRLAEYELSHAQALESLGNLAAGVAHDFNTNALAHWQASC